MSVRDNTMFVRDPENALRRAVFQALRDTQETKDNSGTLTKYKARRTNHFAELAYCMGAITYNEFRWIEVATRVCFR